MIKPPNIESDARAAKRADLAYERERLAHVRRHLLTFDAEQTTSDESFLLKKTALDLLRLQPGSVVLDAGSGSCEVSEYMATRGCEVIAFDLSPDLLLVSKERSRGREYALRYMVADCERTPIRDESVDAVVCWNVLHHLPDATSAVLELRRVLRPGGACLISEPNSLSPLRRIREHGVRRKYGMVEYSFYPWQLHRLLRRNGFELERHRLARFRADTESRRPLLRSARRVLLGRPLDAVFDGLLVLARRPAALGRVHQRNVG